MKPVSDLSSNNQRELRRIARRKQELNSQIHILETERESYQYNSLRKHILYRLLPGVLVFAPILLIFDRSILHDISPSLANEFVDSSNNYNPIIFFIFFIVW